MPKRPMMQDRKPETPRVNAKSDDALLGQERARREVVDLLIREVMPNRKQPRTMFTDESIDELAASIRIHGVLEPIIVREIPLTAYEGHGRHYELIAGERRWRASTRAAIATIPALVLPETTSDQVALELAITENLQREDLHPIDEAITFGRMQRDLDYSYAKIAERLGKSKGYVQNRMRLLQLDEELQQLVIERPDTLSHVYELAKVTNLEQRRALIDEVRRDMLPLAETRARVQMIVVPSPAATSEEPSYLRKYDHAGDEISEEVDTSEERSYLRKYDHAGDEMHNANVTLGNTAAPPRPRSVTSLSSRERAALAAATEKIERYLDDLGLLTAKDWAVLSPLALRLHDLMRQVERAQGAPGTAKAPDTL